jgi:hypothetical protein
MSTQRITVLAAVLALALSGTAALAQDDAQSSPGDGQQQQDQRMPRGGMMGPGQGQGMMGPGQGMMGQGRMGQGMYGPGQGQGMYGPGMRGQGQMGPGGGQGMMGRGQMGPGMMHGGRMRGGMMHRGMMQSGMANAGPTLEIETPGGLTFTCNAGMQACLQAFDHVRAANQGGDGQGN